ncbi:Hypothetical protein MAU_2800 [Metamycoplasma auris 15026]|uniref:Transposase n=1 Tax=Metamycoplasma auris 15026 TaxID=1188233 RepID=N9V0F4_9BACT|nr:UPF0236 family protein [Metamycoplasma auris]ENY68902.1 Hypothetical protein MAU_2800 [Metamycoplasma auris 15026]
MEKLDVDIFNDILDTTNKLYANKAKELNDIEEYFRNTLRKTIHPNWKIFRRETRKWITLGGIFLLNITMYETKDDEGRITRFTYYHDEKLKQICNCKYDTDNLKLAVKFYLENSKIPSNLKQLLPSKQLLNYYLNKLKINEKLLDKNEEILNEIKCNFAKDNEKIYLEMDDFYIFHKSTKVKKMRVREVVAHTLKSNKLSNVINIFFTKNLDDPTTKNNDLEFIKNTINKELITSNYKQKLIVNGDGARWIKKLADKLNATYSLDLFHIQKALNDTFGTNKFVSKENKIYYKTYINKTLNKSWKNVFDEAILLKNEELFRRLWYEFLSNPIALKMPTGISERARNFYKLISNNARAVFDNNEKLKSYTEHFVYNSFKKHIRKEQSLFCFEHIKLKVLYRNIIKNQATLFY